MKKEHEYAQLLRWIADGEDSIQWETAYGNWIDQPLPVTLEEIKNADFDLCRYRLKPKTIRIDA